MNEAFTPPSRDLWLEHALEVSRATARSVERLTRQHYAVAGDLLDFMLAPWQPIDRAADPRTLIDRQSAATDRLMSAARLRAGEYLEILSEFGTGSVVGSATDGPPNAPDATSAEAESAAIVLPDDSPKAADAKTRRARGTKVAAAKDTDPATRTAGGKPARKARKRPTS